MNGYDVITLAKYLRGSKTELSVDKTIAWWEFTSMLTRKANELLDTIGEDNPEAKDIYLKREVELPTPLFLEKAELVALAQLNKWETGISLALLPLVVRE
jgi:hypothetical protein